MYTQLLGSAGSYTVVLRWGVVVKVALPQLQGQSLQSLQLVQSGHAFLDERHHPDRYEGGKKTGFRMSFCSRIDPPVNLECAAGHHQPIPLRCRASVTRLCAARLHGNICGLTNSNVKTKKGN